MQDVYIRKEISGAFPAYHKIENPQTNTINDYNEGDRLTGLSDRSWTKGKNIQTRIN